MTENFQKIGGRIAELSSRLQEARQGKTTAESQAEEYRQLLEQIKQVQPDPGFQVSPAGNDLELVRLQKECLAKDQEISRLKLQLDQDTLRSTIRKRIEVLLSRIEQLEQNG